MIPDAGFLGYRVSLPEIGVLVAIVSNVGVWYYRIVSTGEDRAALHTGRSTGPQAAANAAERWLVARAELTLKLAGRRVAA